MSALLPGSKKSFPMEVDQLEVCSDSQLVVKQIEDSYEARGEKMILYLKKVRELLKKFVRVQIRHIPRAENSRADTLAKLATASPEDLNRLTPVEHLSEPSIDLNNEEISPVMSKPSWMDPIWDYCQTTRRRHLSLGRGLPGSLFIKEPFISEVFSYSSSSALQGKTPTTC